MSIHRVLAATAIALCIEPHAVSYQNVAESEEHVRRIVGEAIAGGGAYRFLELLTDSIGGRVTGTTESRKAADLLLTTLRRYGFDAAHFEEYDLASPWRRSSANGCVVSPVERPLAIGTYGWVPGTNGDVTAPLVDMGAPGRGELEFPDRVRGAAVIVEPHAVEGAPSQVMRASLARALARAGAVAMLIPSDKPNRMLYTSAFGFYPRGALPVLSIAKEDVFLLRRFLANGPVRIRLNVANSFDIGPLRERNIVAEIAGTAPGEAVVVGAHFDSWDAGQGAQDDGAGVAAVLETARILKALGIRPRRTIRFVFFSGEEQGLLGSRAYVERHRKELNGLRAVIIMGTREPTQRVGSRSTVDLTSRLLLELSSLHRRLHRAVGRHCLRLRSNLAASGVTLEADFAMDHAPFLAEGIPVFTLWVDEEEYGACSLLAPRLIAKRWAGRCMAMRKVIVLYICYPRRGHASARAGRRRILTAASSMAAGLCRISTSGVEPSCTNS